MEQSIWHDASKEMPQENGDILFRTQCEDFIDKEWQIGWKCGDEIESHTNFFKQSEVDKWCYLKDLMALAE